VKLSVREFVDSVHELNCMRDVLRVLGVKEFHHHSFFVCWQPDKIVRKHHGIDDAAIIEHNAHK
jgi:hypothetical protein